MISFAEASDVRCSITKRLSGYRGAIVRAEQARGRRNRHGNAGLANNPFHIPGFEQDIMMPYMEFICFLLLRVFVTHQRTAPSILWITTRPPWPSTEKETQDELIKVSHNYLRNDQQRFMHMAFFSGCLPQITCELHFRSGLRQISRHDFLLIRLASAQINNIFT